VAGVVKRRGLGNANGIIHDLFLLSLNRPPTPRERTAIAAASRLNDPRVKDTPIAAYQDLLWALLNSNEFMLNH
jgi:hypothetical protein